MDDFISRQAAIDALEGTIKIEEMKQAPEYYAYYDPNSPVLGAKGDKK